MTGQIQFVIFIYITFRAVIIVEVKAIDCLLYFYIYQWQISYNIQKIHI